MQISKLLASRLLLGLFLAGLIALPASAREKGGMPDLSQQEQTCLPTSTANLIIWFGQHGYPKLLQSGATEDERELHTLHVIMAATNARYDLGTRTDAITYGIGKYIRDAGYSCDVEYRGMDWSMAKYPEIVKDVDGEKYQANLKPPSPFTQDWLQENNDPNKGFILLLAYCKFDRASNTFSDAINAGHAVTLVNAEPNMILIHDPAHAEDEPGRKILTPELLTGGAFQLPGYNAPVSGLLLLTGSLLETPPDSGVMLTGAVCITMHPETIEASTASPMPTVGANATIVGKGSGTPAPSSSPAPAAPATPPSSPSTSWAMWLFDLLFKK
jgi:hypothetical protein